MLLVTFYLILLPTSESWDFKFTHVLSSTTPVRVHVLVCSGWCEKKKKTKPTDWMAYKQQIISHSSGAWEVQDQGASTFHVWWGPTFWAIDFCLLSITSHDRRGEGFLWGLFYRDTKFHSCRQSPLKGHTSKYHHLGGLRLQHVNFGQLHTLSIAVHDSYVEHINQAKEY